MRYRTPGERPDGDAVDHFLVDGVAPPVIGEGPPEVAPVEDPGRHRAAPAPPRRHEPPTDPIPVVHQLPPAQETQPRKGLLARIFRPR